MRIADNWLKASWRKYRPKLLERADRDGLTVRVSTTGKISFVVRLRYDGSRNTKRLVIGSYPRMSLQSARAETGRLRARLEQGHDPRIVRKLEKHAIAKAPSYETLFRLWYERYCTKNKAEHHALGSPTQQCPPPPRGFRCRDDGYTGAGTGCPSDSFVETASD